MLQEIISTGVNGLLGQSPAEMLAVSLAIAYLILAMRQSIWCWPCAFISTALFTWVFFDALLFMEALLNIYYMGMAVYGFWCWKTKIADNAVLSISTWRLSRHGFVLALILTLSLLSGFILTKQTDAAWPYLDSFTTWGSVITTYMVARKIFENWFYWLVIDAIALFLYIDRGLYPSAVLMMIYLVLVVIGIYSWRKQMHQQLFP